MKWRERCIWSVNVPWPMDWRALELLDAAVIACIKVPWDSTWWNLLLAWSWHRETTSSGCIGLCRSSQAVLSPCCQISPPVVCL